MSISLRLHLLLLLVFHLCYADRSSVRLPGIPLHDHLSFNSVASTSSFDSPCQQSLVSSPMKFHLRHRHSDNNLNKSQTELMVDSTHRDKDRISTIHRRIVQKTNQNIESRTRKNSHRPGGRFMLEDSQPSTAMTMRLESGVSQGSGEYFMDVFIGTPPRRFSLILDTGSDLNWIQCVPCHDCFPQHGPHYDPSLSSSYRNVTCHDPRCALVSSPNPPRKCQSHSQSCPYFYWYGDLSNTTGDLAVESFTVNLTDSSRAVHDVVFGCGHWNRGLFHGAAGLLGLGRGPLSFTSQLKSLYGHPAFSYCLVDRNSNATVSSKLVLGEDPRLMSHPNLNFTAFASAAQTNSANTFYYLAIKSILVAGEALPIPPNTFKINSSDAGGGTIIDSGTTLSYFADPAYETIRDAFIRKMGEKNPRVEGFPLLDPCFNVSGAGDGAVDVPEFAILFEDGAIWNFPPENYFIKLESEGVICLAMLGLPRSSLSIIGNYQQQNFHILYDTHRSRLGFAPMNCAHI